MNPLSPCGISYPFFTLYQNQLSDGERFTIIQDINLHIGDVDIVHLYGFQDIETMVTLKQNVKIKLGKLLLALYTNQTNNRLFLQVEKETDPEAIVCVFNKVDKETVMANIPFLSTYIKQCVIDTDLEKIFSYDDFSISFPAKTIPVKVGNLQVNTRPIPQDVQEHTARVLNLMESPKEKWVSSPSFSLVTSATYTSSHASIQASSFHWPFTSPSITPANTGLAMSSSIETRFQQLKNHLDESTTRMDSIQNLCCQIKGNNDMIVGQLHQLTSDLQAQALSAPAAKLTRFS